MKHIDSLANKVNNYQYIAGYFTIVE